MKVAVLGGGHGAFATAADLALAGHAVRLWRRAGAELEALRTAGGLTLVAEGRRGKAVLDRITADLAEAVTDADVVVIPLPATSHEDVARRLAPLLTGQELLLLTPGTLGAFVMAREIARAGGRLPRAIAETGTLPYLARKTGPAEITVAVRAANLPTGVFPAAQGVAALGPIRELFPTVRACADVLDAALTNAGPVIHAPLVLVNAGAIDQGHFDIHAAGTTASARRLIEAVDAERIGARRGWGYPPPHYDLATYYEEARAAEGLYGEGARARLTASGLWSEPIDLDHRYVTEDVALGLTLFESAARTVGVDTPATSGLLRVFGTLLGRPLVGQGRDLDHLGLGELLRREIQAMLHDGWASPYWARVIR